MLVDYAETFYLYGFVVLQLCAGFPFTFHQLTFADGSCLADVGVVHEWIFPSPVASYGTQVVDAVLNSTIHCAATDGSCTVAVEEIVKPSMEFLPLMLTSLYCALGIVWAWLRLSWVYLWK